MYGQKSALEVFYGDELEELKVDVETRVRAAATEAATAAVSSGGIGILLAVAAVFFVMSK